MGLFIAPPAGGGPGRSAAKTLFAISKPSHGQTTVIPGTARMSATSSME
jgi:hypothetical protein